MFVGIDMGGTSTRIAALQDGRVIASDCFATAEISLRGRPGVVAQLCQRLTALVSRCQGDSAGSASGLSAIGLAVAGVIDRKTGTVIRSVNLKAMEGFAVARELSEPAGCAVFLTTDVHAATWGEYLARTSAGENSPQRFAHLRLGTGVACGIVIDGAFVPLDEPRTTHAPTLIADHSDAARLCSCGLRGCLETIASGPALSRTAATCGYDSSVAALQNAATAGDPEAVDAVDHAAGAVLAAIDNVERNLGPFPWRLGGGVFDGLPLLYQAVTRRAEHSPAARVQPAALHAYKGNVRPDRALPPRIQPAALGGMAGAVGAAALAEQHLGPRA